MELVGVFIVKWNCEIGRIMHNHRRNKGIT